MSGRCVYDAKLFGWKKLNHFFRLRGMHNQLNNDTDLFNSPKDCWR